MRAKQLANLVGVHANTARRWIKRFELEHTPVALAERKAM
jgi:transposase